MGDYDDSACRTGEAFAGKPSLGSTPMGARVTAQLHHDERYYGSTNQQAQNARRNRLRDRIGLGGLWGNNDDDEF